MGFRDRLVILDQATSTNEILFRSSFEDYPLGTALLAKEQTQGRGRAQRVWESNRGGMYLSVMWETQKLEGLSLLGAYCVLSLCREKWGLPVQIRWPNDVVLYGKKLAGVLPQVKFVGTVAERVVLGVGLNVNQSPESFSDQVADESTTLAHHLSVVPEIEILADSFLARLEAELEEFEATGCPVLCERCEEFLEGFGEHASGRVWHESGITRALGPLKGLGSQGELLFESGEVLRHLSPQERLRFES